ncbi:MAG: hypothetical protein EOP09_15845 [Proteobacteria bacterium]|nr:MAG: hypothetical protein EOP09_15845 [Pseudomonadota bacterium]
MKLSLAQDPSLDYAGMDLKSDLRTVLNQETTACILQYQGSDGAPYQLALDQISANIYDLSFDPYDCPELRWGDLSKSARQRCTNDEEKNHWYRALRKLRNQADRTYDVRMDYTRDELEAPSCTLGVESPLATNLIELLK